MESTKQVNFQSSDSENLVLQHSMLVMIPQSESLERITQRLFKSSVIILNRRYKLYCVATTLEATDPNATKLDKW